MPGLVGIVSINGDKADLRLMEAMHNVIRHRDWYKIDDYVNTKGTVAVSRVYLNIINRDKQPYSARGGKVKVFLCGEIYNDQAAGANPLEFIYHLYEKQGINFASFLNGSFVITIVDEDEDTILISNDRLATRPLFYFNDGRAIYFGPEMKSLLLIPSLKKKLNPMAVANFLASGYFAGKYTLIEGLEAVDSATVLKITPGGATRHKYWEYPFKYGFQREGKERSLEYYQEKFDALLRKAVSRRLQTNNTYGILLSGGYDSRGILGYYLEEKHDQKLCTISWGREEDIPDSDCIIAKRLAQKLGANHRFYKLTAREVFDNWYDFIWLGEGRTSFPESYEVFHRIKEQQDVDIVLRGDEWFGVQSPCVHDEHTMFCTLGLKVLRNMSEYQKVLKTHYYQMFCKLNDETMRCLSSRCRAKNTRDRKEFFYLDRELKHYLNPLNYVKTFALESFTPWLDYEILDFVSTLPIEHRLDKSLYRKTVLTAFPELFEEVAQRHNMIDWTTSFKSSSELERFIYRELIEEQSVIKEFIDTDGLKSELDAFFAAPQAPSIKARAKVNALRLLAKSPATHDFAHKCFYYVQKRRGRVRDNLPIEQLIIRLLILKTWGDVFLNYPTWSDL